jgi:hypothetical protein
MARQLHSASAAAAITFVLCVACFSFVVFVLLPAVSVYPHGITVEPVSVEARNIARAVGMVLLLWVQRRRIWMDATYCGGMECTGLGRC